MRKTKVVSLSIRHFRTIPHSAPSPHTCLMDRPTTAELETAREIDDLHDQVKNLRSQLDFSAQQLRTLRVRTARYEAILGMEEAA
jgi:hypothetical protein